mmetsp:Transcript_6683/g.28037  ORF Transcript_6683/g.28037 Transcript_6683/m.28037 type:complete len:264 (-) Transcript_6683:312-1103(-)
MSTTCDSAASHCTTRLRPTTAAMTAPSRSVTTARHSGRHATRSDPVATVNAKAAVTMTTYCTPMSCVDVNRPAVAFMSTRAVAENPIDTACSAHPATSWRCDDPADESPRVCRSPAAMSSSAPAMATARNGHTRASSLDGPPLSHAYVVRRTIELALIVVRRRRRSSSRGRHFDDSAMMIIWTPRLVRNKNSKIYSHRSPSATRATAAVENGANMATACTCHAAVSPDDAKLLSARAEQHSPYATATSVRFLALHSASAPSSR